MKKAIIVLMAILCLIAVVSCSQTVDAPELEFDDSTLKGQIYKTLYESLDLPVYNSDSESPTDIATLYNLTWIPIYSPEEIESVSIKQSTTFDISPGSSIEYTGANNPPLFNNFTVNNNISGTIEMKADVSDFVDDYPTYGFTSITDQGYKFTGNFNDIELNDIVSTDVSKITEHNYNLVLGDYEEGSAPTISFKTSRPEGMNETDEGELFQVLDSMRFYTNESIKVNVSSTTTEREYVFVSDYTVSATTTEEFYEDMGSALVTVYIFKAKEGGQELGVLTKYEIYGSAFISFGIMEIDGEKVLIPTMG